MFAMVTHVLNIKGMTCEGCAQTITNSLRGMPGVRDAKVDPLTKTARVEHDERVSNLTDLFTAVQRAGFQVDGFTTVSEAD
ncbi:MAG: hypothetical protein AMXMBFR13_19260 [Phycisphaerae bacterium]